MEDGFVKVISPIEDTPAFRAGIKPGDLIIKLDDTPVKGMTLNDAVKRMRGKPNTQITLTISRKGEAAPIVVTLTRAVIRVQSVKSKMIEPGYAWVRVSQFQEATTENLVKHLDDLFKQGPVKGLVLDLRNDPGGLLLRRGGDLLGVPAAEGRWSCPPTAAPRTRRKKFYASPEDYLRGARDDVLKGLPAAVKTVPMVVLVNGGSASASEIVAGALQDHKRATVIGTQTFGKGSVQTIMPLGNNTAIKLTTARYYTPSGRSIQAKGITPDIIVEEPGRAPRRALREADLERHLSNDRDKGADKKAGARVQAGGARRRREQPKPLELGSKDDFQLVAGAHLPQGRAGDWASPRRPWPKPSPAAERPAAPPLQPAHPPHGVRHRGAGAAARGAARWSSAPAAWAARRRSTSPRAASAG